MKLLSAKCLQLIKASSPALAAVCSFAEVTQAPANTCSLTSPWQRLKETEMGKTALPSVYNLETGSYANAGVLNG